MMLKELGFCKGHLLRNSQYVLNQRNKFNLPTEKSLSIQQSVFIASIQNSSSVSRLISWGHTQVSPSQTVPPLQGLVRHDSSSTLNSGSLQRPSGVGSIRSLQRQTLSSQMAKFDRHLLVLALHEYPIFLALK